MLELMMKRISQNHPTPTMVKTFISSCKTMLVLPSDSKHKLEFINYCGILSAAFIILITILLAFSKLLFILQAKAISIFSFSRTTITQHPC